MFNFKVIAEMKHTEVFPESHDYTDLDIKIETVEHGKRVAKYVCESTPELGDKLHHIDIEWQSSVNVKFDIKAFDDALIFRDRVLASGHKAVSILKYRDCDYYTVEIKPTIELFVGEYGKQFGQLMLNFLQDFAPKGRNSVNHIYASMDSTTISFIDPIGYAQALVALERFAKDFSGRSDDQILLVKPVPATGVAIGEYQILINFEDKAK